MAGKTKQSKPDPAKMSFEEAIESLEAIIQEIEEGTVGLEESIESYQRGVGLIKRCRSILDAAEQQIETLALDDPGGKDAERET